MVTTPPANIGQRITTKVLVNGKPIPAAHQLLSVDVWTAVNKVPLARVVIADGTQDHSRFPISTSRFYVPGNSLEIHIGYDNDTTNVFDGVITTHGLDMESRQTPRLVVEAAHSALVLTLGRQTKISTNKRDSDLMEALIRGHHLQADVSRTSVQHPSLVQYGCSDWDFLLLRAEVNGMVVTSSADKKVTVAAPDTRTSPQLKLVYGQSIRQAHLTLDATSQLHPVALRSRAWDPTTQALAEGVEPQVDIQELGNLSSQTLANVFNVSSALQQTPGALRAAALSSWSKASLLRLRLAKVRGQLHCHGTAAPKPAGMVALAGLGDRFDGNAFISAVHHHVEPGDWITQVDIGLSPEPFAVVNSDISAPPASGQLAAISHLQVGIVDQARNDPQGQMRVPIRLPLAPPDSPPIWARLSAPYATDKAGIQFWPEQGDEVIVAFMDNDPRFPVVLGSLYSNKKATPETFTPDSEIKSIVSKTQMRIKMDEKAKALEISTPGKRKIRLDDQNGILSLADSYGNKITFEKSGIKIHSNGSILLKANNDINIKAGVSLSIEAPEEATLKSTNISIQADGVLSADGRGQASLSSSGELSIRGAMVMIN